MAKLALNASRFQEASYFRNVFAVNVDAGHKIEDIEQPEYWAHVARHVKQFDEIVIRAEDGAFYARLYVLDCGDTWLKTHRLDYVELQKSADKEILSRDGEFKIKWAGPHDKWRVTRVSDGEIVAKEIVSRDGAEDWVREYRKVMTKRVAAE